MAALFFNVKFVYSFLLNNNKNKAAINFFKHPFYHINFYIFYRTGAKIIKQLTKK